MVYLDGQGDLVSRFIRPTTRITTNPLYPIIHRLTMSLCLSSKDSSLVSYVEGLGLGA